MKKIFDTDSILSWKKEWIGMPDYTQGNLMPWKTVDIHFRNYRDLQKFAALIKQKITLSTKFRWFPQEEEMRDGYAYLYKSNLKDKNPRYPVYIISKGRWESRLTSKVLEKMKVPYKIVIEPQEYDNYAAVIDSKKILVLPFSNLGQGSIPARNWVWDHAVKKIKAERHWILDDNILWFGRFNNNEIHPCADGAMFRLLEDFVDRYENIGIAGFHYQMFVPSRDGLTKPPYYLNTRVYSNLLIRNDLPFRWRGRYNEDTDLCLRVLKAGWCTVLFNAFVADKIATMTMKGGNTEELYKDDGRFQMAESLRKQHPDIVKITKRWGRWQHLVDYRKFARNKLKRKKGLKVKNAVNEYGMKLVENVKDEFFTLKKTQVLENPVRFFVCDDCGCTDCSPEYEERVSYLILNCKQCGAHYKLRNVVVMERLESSELMKPLDVIGGEKLGTVNNYGQVYRIKRKKFIKRRKNRKSGET